MLAGRPIAGSLRSTISSPTTSPGRTAPSWVEKQARRIASPTGRSAQLLLVALPVLRGVARRESTDDFDHAEEDGEDAHHDDHRGQGPAGMADTQEAQSQSDDTANEVQPPVRQVVVLNGGDDVEDTQHQE